MKDSIILRFLIEIEDFTQTLRPKPCTRNKRKDSSQKHIIFISIKKGVWTSRFI
jgi:hypothetical protein